MRAVVFHKPKDVRVENVPDARIEDERDAIIRVTATAICGSDLHIYNGLVPQPRPMVLGHEFMGIVEETGPGVRNLKKGDRVVVPFPIACGHCFFCDHGLQPHCENSNADKYGPLGGLLHQKGGALFGYSDLYGGYDGGDAEAVRVPYADYGPRRVPDELTDEQVLFLTDILPTAWTGLEWAGMKAGDTVAVVGSGPVGLMAQKLAWLRGAERVIALDVQEYRLQTAQRTANAETINVKEVDKPEEVVWSMTEGRGADVVIEAVGMEVDQNILEKAADVLHGQAGSIKAIELAFKLARRGGHVSIMGVYATDYDNFPLGQAFDKGLHLHLGQSTPHEFIEELMGYIREGRLRADDIITHRAVLEDAPKLFETFNDKRDDCVKVVLRP